MPLRLRNDPIAPKVEVARRSRDQPSEEDVTEKFPTQAMGDGTHKGQPDGTNGATDVADDEKRSNPYAEAKNGKRPKHKWRGGQSAAAYHGPQQLGDQVVTPGGNPNSASKI
jgi:hypothetical protein